MSSDPRGRHAYAPCYCEENVWHLAGDADLAPGPRHVVFIAGTGGHVAVWCQRAAERSDEPVLWDYHVVLLAGGQVYDLDSTLSFPVPLRDYLSASFRAVAPAPLRPRFRVVDADGFRASFASDRSHMATAAVPPPPWPLIRTADCVMNLASFVDVSHPGPGTVLDRDDLAARFA